MWEYLQPIFTQSQRLPTPRSQQSKAANTIQKSTCQYQLSTPVLQKTPASAFSLNFSSYPHLLTPNMPAPPHHPWESFLQQCTSPIQPSTVPVLPPQTLPFLLQKWTPPIHLSVINAPSSSAPLLSAFLYQIFEPCLLSLKTCLILWLSVQPCLFSL